MARPLDYDEARRLLADGLREAEKLFADGQSPSSPEHVAQCFDAVFASRTQAYREVLLGCIIARILDKRIDLRLPYASQGDNAFNGRTLDEEVVNPFLRASQIPCSTGPYLNVFRRQVRFDEGTRDGVRDKAGYDALLGVLEYVRHTRSNESLLQLLTCMLHRFVLLRERTNVPLARIHRVSLRQYATLLEGLLHTPSGGRLPVLIVEAMLRSIKDAFSLDWTVDCQGINVSDRSAGASADITVTRQGITVMAIEVTERPVDEARVVSTFRTKIAPRGIEDYVFLVNLRSIPDAAIRQADQYFAQGHEVNFVDVATWVMSTLVTVGASGRNLFNSHLQESLSSRAVPEQLRAAWNAAVGAITTR